jgi:hypothetical protein
MQGGSRMFPTTDFSNFLPEELYEPGYVLPNHYNKTFGALLPIDRSKAYVYWELSSFTKEKFQEEHGPDSWQNSCPVLRLFWGENHKTIQLQEETDNWYVSLEGSQMPDKAQIGRLFKDGLFVPLLTLTIFWQNAGFPLWQESEKQLHKYRLLKQIMKNWQPGISSWSPNRKRDFNQKG